MPRSQRTDIGNYLYHISPERPKNLQGGLKKVADPIKLSKIIKHPLSLLS